MQYECGEYPDRIFFCPECNQYWQEHVKYGGGLGIRPLHS
jgi:hypothetical protein